MLAMKKTLTAAVLVAALAVPGLAAAQQQIDESRPAASDVRIEIEDIIVGSIRVVGADTDQMTVTGTIGADVDEFVIEGGPAMIELRVELTERDDEDGERRWHGRDHQDVAVNLEIRVPNGASLEMAGVTAEFDVEGVHGAIEIDNVTGSIVYSGNASALELANVTGSITATAPNVMNGDLESVNGAISFTGSVATGGELSIENINGQIDVTVPSDISASFSVETMVGEIDNAFGQEPEQANRWMPAKELSFTNGSGSAEIHIETMQGPVHIRHQ
jgi:hypothetical protein